MVPAMKALMLFLLTSLLLCGAGCMHWQTDQFPAPSWNPTGYASPMITKKDAIYTHPGKQNLRIGRAGLMIFRTHPDFAEVGPAFTEIFHRELLAKRTFSEVVLIPETYTTAAEAMRQARRHQVNIVLLGELPYYLDGGTVGTSGLQVDLKVREVESGRLLWSLSESVKATPRPIVCLMVTETRPYPTPSMGTLASRLAGRLATTLQEGPPPPPTGIRSWFSAQD